MTAQVAQTLLQLIIVGVAIWGLYRWIRHGRF